MSIFVYLNCRYIYTVYKYLITWWNWSAGWRFDSWQDQIRGKLNLLLKLKFLLSFHKCFTILKGGFHLTINFCQCQMMKCQRDLKKISMKTLHKLFKDIKSCGLVSVQFLSVLHFFYHGDIQTSQDTITEL